MKLYHLVISIGIPILLCQLVNRCRTAPTITSDPNLLRDYTYSTLDSPNSSINVALDPTVYLREHFANKSKYSGDKVQRNLRRDIDKERNVSEIITSRGFEVEEYDVVTKDGYILTIQRIINPLIKKGWRKRLKPIIMQHGLMSSSVDWVINSLHVRPAPYPQAHKRSMNIPKEIGAKDPFLESQEHPNSLGFYLANQGFDVFLSNSRGNVYAQRHTSMTTWDFGFWDFSFDEQIIYDLPDTIEFVQKLTGHLKVGYVGHSQGTTLMFGLMSERPEYADIVEPFIALAPVAFVDHSLSIARYLGVYISNFQNLPIFKHINMWFVSFNTMMRFLTPLLCGYELRPDDVCHTLFYQTIGYNLDEIDNSRLSAYLSHFPAGTSAKNIAHYGQEVLSRKFAKFDYGKMNNQFRYGQDQPPEYILSNIRSKSIALFFAEDDKLSDPEDIARLTSDLKVQPFAIFNMTEAVPKWSHIDFLYGKHAGKLINAKIYEILDHFRQ